MMRKMILSALLIAWAGAAPAQQAASGDADAERGQLPGGAMLRADDILRFDQFDATFGAALREALAGAAPEDLSQLLAALQGTPMTPEAAASTLPGDWSCQMMKVGKNLPLVVYQPFRCRAGADGAFEKLTGSQRTVGTTALWEGKLIYVGTSFNAGDTPVPYADLPDVPDPQSLPQLLPDVGLVELTGADRGRIIFPQPYLESRLNVLMLRR